MVRRRDLIGQIFGAAILSRRAAAQSKMTPDEGFRSLMSGNDRFAANRFTSIEHDLQILRNHTVDKQEPFAGVLSCADSRVPVELIFDQTIGQIFVTRVAGNILTPEIIGSLEYGVAVLGLKVVVILGHASCGAVKAAMKGDSVPGQISVLYQRLQAGISKAGGDVNKAIELNAAAQADLLRTSSPVIRDAIKAKTLRVESGVYDLGAGRVKIIEKS
jgi:carbonic anhydrase